MYVCVCVCVSRFNQIPSSYSNTVRQLGVPISGKLWRHSWQRSTRNQSARMECSIDINVMEEWTCECTLVHDKFGAAANEANFDLQQMVGLEALCPTFHRLHSNSKNIIICSNVLFWLLQFSHIKLKILFPPKKFCLTTSTGISTVSFLWQGHEKQITLYLHWKMCCVLVVKCWSCCCVVGATLSRPLEPQTVSFSWLTCSSHQEIWLLLRALLTSLH